MSFKDSSKENALGNSSKGHTKQKPPAKAAKS